MSDLFLWSLSVLQPPGPISGYIGKAPGKGFRPHQWSHLDEQTRAKGQDGPQGCGKGESLSLSPTSAHLQLSCHPLGTWLVTPKHRHREALRSSWCLHEAKKKAGIILPGIPPKLLVTYLQWLCFLENLKIRKLFFFFSLLKIHPWRRHYISQQWLLGSGFLPVLLDCM